MHTAVSIHSGNSQHAVLLTQEKLERFLRVKHDQGREIKSELRNSRAYRNPSFLQKMVEHSSIKEFGSNILDPDSLHEEVAPHASGAFMAHRSWQSCHVSVG